MVTLRIHNRCDVKCTLCCAAGGHTCCLLHAAEQQPQSFRQLPRCSAGIWSNMQVGLGDCQAWILFSTSLQAILSSDVGASRGLFCLCRNCNVAVHMRYWTVNSCFNARQCYTSLCLEPALGGCPAHAVHMLCMAHGRHLGQSARCRPGVGRWAVPRLRPEPQVHWQCVRLARLYI